MEFGKPDFQKILHIGIVVGIHARKERQVQDLTELFQEEIHRDSESRLEVPKDPAIRLALEWRIFPRGFQKHQHFVGVPGKDFLNCRAKTGEDSIAGGVGIEQERRMTEEDFLSG
jgi:lysine/ornithine N-monooxygenase